MDRQGLVFLARLSEQAERYDEMVERVTELASSAKEDLSVEERNLFSVAFKNATGARRASWRILSALPRHRSKGFADFPELTTSLRASVEDELTTMCMSIMKIIDDKLLPLASASPESEVFYLKMKGDYGRYMAEYVADAAARKRIVAEALRDYERAQEIALTEIAPTNYLRLGLALNFSVFHYDIVGDTPAACAMAKQAFDDAIAELDALENDDSYRDSTLVMQLLRQNITLWTSTDNDELDDVAITDED
jgi:14-3-3 protein epsilon